MTTNVLTTSYNTNGVYMHTCHGNSKVDLRRVATVTASATDVSITVTAARTAANNMLRRRYDQRQFKRTKRPAACFDHILYCSRFVNVRPASVSGGHQIPDYFGWGWLVGSDYSQLGLDPHNCSNDVCPDTATGFTYCDGNVWATNGGIMVTCAPSPPPPAVQTPPTTPPPSPPPPPAPPMTCCGTIAISGNANAQAAQGSRLTTTMMIGTTRYGRPVYQQ